jgi:hypothetical protein
MAYDEQLAARVQALLPAHLEVQERKMFGGLAFLIGGHMSCGLVGERLMVRIAPESYDRALAQPHVLPMDFTGKVMRGFIFVEPAGIAADAELSDWLNIGVAFASSLPAK